MRRKMWMKMMMMMMMIRAGRPVDLHAVNRFHAPIRRRAITLTQSVTHAVSGAVFRAVATAVSNAVT